MSSSEVGSLVDKWLQNKEGFQVEDWKQEVDNLARPRFYSLLISLILKRNLIERTILATSLEQKSNQDSSEFEITTVGMCFLSDFQLEQLKEALNQRLDEEAGGLGFIDQNEQQETCNIIAKKIWSLFDDSQDPLDAKFERIITVMSGYSEMFLAMCEVVENTCNLDDISLLNDDQFIACFETAFSKKDNFIGHITEALHRESRSSMQGFEKTLRQKFG